MSPSNLAITTPETTSETLEPLSHWARVSLPEQDPARTRLSREELRPLAEARGDACVSIAMPTHEVGAEVQQDRIRLGNLLSEATTKLEQQGLTPADAERVLAPTRALEDDTEFWNHGRPGLVLLLSEAESHVFKVPRAVEPMCWVGPRYRTTPLLSLVEDDRFAVLALSASSVRLFIADRGELRQQPQGDIPHRLEDVVGYQTEEASVQWHTRSSAGPGRSPAVYHGHGVGHDDQNHERTAFVRRVAEAVIDQLPRRDMPVVVAAVERTVAELRQHAAGLKLTPEAVQGDPEDMNLASLHAAAWACAEPVLKQPVERARQRVGDQMGTERVSTKLASVLRAALEGRVDLLLVAPDATRWGRFDSATGDVEAHDDARAGDDDLVDLAVTLALARGAEVHMVERDQLPGDGQLAALYRY